MALGTDKGVTPSTLESRVIHLGPWQEEGVKIPECTLVIFVYNNFCMIFRLLIITNAKL
jgi:hypothetical protein